jgi:hypothetical protein
MVTALCLSFYLKRCLEKDADLALIMRLIFLAVIVGSDIAWSAAKEYLSALFLNINCIKKIFLY